jgi:hypothetical protein
VRGGLDEAGRDGGRRRGRPGRDVEFGKDPSDVVLDGAHTDEELSGDRPIGIAGDEASEDIEFSSRQRRATANGCSGHPPW